MYAGIFEKGDSFFLVIRSVYESFSPVHNKLIKQWTIASLTGHAL